MQADHRLGHRFAGLVSDALIFVAPSLRIRVHGALLRRTAGRPLAHPGRQPPAAPDARRGLARRPPTRKELLTRPTIVLVHGAFAESSSWDGVIDPLLDAGIR